jgi:hypothetical protein
MGHASQNQTAKYDRGPEAARRTAVKVLTKKIRVLTNILLLSKVSLDALTFSAENKPLAYLENLLQMTVQCPRSSVD